MPVAQRTPGALQLTSENRLRGVVQGPSKTHATPDEVDWSFRLTDMGLRVA